MGQSMVWPRKSRKSFAEFERAIELYEKLGLLLNAGGLRAFLALQLCKDDDESLTDMSRAMKHFNQAERELAHGPENESVLWLYIGMSDRCVEDSRRKARPGSFSARDCK